MPESSGPENARVTGRRRQPDMTTDAAAAITGGRTALGIELGSTRIKAVLIGPDHAPLAVGSHDWENQFVDRVWTYSLDAVWTGLQECVRGPGRRRRGDGTACELTTVGAPRASRR